MTDLSTAELRDIAEQAAKEAVRETLLTLGINVSDPLSAQQDFIVLREMRDLMKDKEFQADIAHLRKWRTALDAARTKGFLTVVGILATGAVGFLVVGFKTWLERGGH